MLPANHEREPQPHDVDAGLEDAGKLKNCDLPNARW
jgi:hypothetical protein